MSTSTDTLPADAEALSVTDKLRTAFAEAAAAREVLDVREDNVRALVSEALADGITWAELEVISGVGSIPLCYRYGPADAPEVTVAPIDPLAFL